METVLCLAMGAVLALAGLVLWTRSMSFGAQKASDYAAHGPAFDIRRELNGPLLCEGVIYGPTGRVTSRFVADMHATWEGNVGRMTESFRYDSGNVQDREWTLTLGNDGIIRAEAPDLKGTGYGAQRGSAVKLDYTIQLPDEAGGHVLRTTDWMYLIENGTIINRSQFRKFGFKVAELVATMRRVEAP